jgi:diadenosine tetraphosphate (Ap4A) HIT family hydrolase
MRDTTGQLGLFLARAVTAVEEVTHAERVYCLSFGEVDRRLHFHVFPRTEWLLDAYWRDTGRQDEPVNGPVLFEWARASFAVRGHGAPQAVGLVAETCAALRVRLASPAGKGW